MMKKPDQRYLIALQLGQPAFLQNAHPFTPLKRGFSLKREILKDRDLMTEIAKVSLYCMP